MRSPDKSHPLNLTISPFELDRVIQEFLSSIEENDPSSITFIFGDHGPWLSRTVRFEDDPAFFVRDRFGVLGAILTAGDCSQLDFKYFSKEFITPERVMAGVFRCLAKSPSEVDLLFNFQERFDFESYLYE